MSDAGAAAPPASAEFLAPPSWHAIDFLSDLHLGQATPRTFEALSTHLRCTAADAVFILGDLFEAWVGDDARHEGFEAECAAMLAEASSHRSIAFMAGNRDFLVGDEMLTACGVMRLGDPSVLCAFDSRVLLSHGDALCLSDVAYQRFRGEVRSDAWQSRFLAQPLSERRRIALELRTESQRRQRDQPQDEWFDVDDDEAQRWMEAARTPTLIHGHTHRPATHPIAPGLVRHVLSDWDFDHSTAAPRADVLRLTASGLERIAPAHAG